MQVIVIGELVSEWKNILTLNNKAVANTIFHYINFLSCRAVKIFEQHNDADFNPEKDFIGLNILLALTLFNITIDHYVTES
jgi:hypothetical protein